MSNIIPDHITTREDAISWLHRHGYSADMAQTEADAWEAGYVPAEEPEIIVEVPAEVATEVEEEWDDEEDEEEDYSDDEEDES